MYHKPDNISGFTLVELMITVSIAGILMAMAIPSFNSTIRSNRLTTYTNELVASLNLARSEAVKRGVSVTVRKVDNNSFTNLSAAANWENGWDVFTDADSDGNYEAGDILIRTYAPLQSSYTLRGNNNFTNFIQYTSSGISNNIGSFVICDNNDGNNTPEANTSRLITVNAIGRPHLGVDSDNDGIPEKDDSTEIVSCTVSPF
jgi:type IV fimbrial biogenesis protein FimT